MTHRDVAPRLVLASGSPRRRQILDLLGLTYAVRVPHVSEELVDGREPAAEAVRLARDKAEAVEASAGELILAADTMVALDDEVLGKPGNPSEAVDMLRRLQGRRHTVFTGVCLRLDGRSEEDVAVTEVWFRSLDTVECREYVDTGEPLDKAGAYGIQGFGATLVQRIEGEYFNVMGLPVQTFLSLIVRFGLRYAPGRLEVR
jgi:septum formation protein